MLTLQVRKGKDSEWVNNRTKTHRLSGPSVICYNSNGKKCFESYRANDLLHRLNGPAFTCWKESGRKYVERFSVNGNYMRIVRYD